MRVLQFKEVARNPAYIQLLQIAAKFRDAFHYDPGHSDLDNEQPIHIHVTLGDWRKLNWLLNVLASDS